MMSKKQKEQWLRVSTLRAEAPEGMSIQALLDALAALDTPTKEADSKTVAPPRLAILAKKNGSNKAFCAGIKLEK